MPPVRQFDIREIHTKPGIAVHGTFTMDHPFHELCAPLRRSRCRWCRTASDRLHEQPQFFAGPLTEQPDLIPVAVRLKSITCGQDTRAQEPRFHTGTAIPGLV